MEIFKKDIVLETQKQLSDIVSSFEEQLKNNKWKVQSNVQNDQGILQAQKAGILRDIIAADRALTFTFKNEEGKLNVSVGVGKLLQNLGVAAIETILLSELFLVVDVPEILWTDHVETELIGQLKSIAS
ncbi:MAG: hypothetical protein M1477_03740 [Candidatus Thermoplasmatota archaeon]|nr:hypothetical protein [Candidatus Thermoplasmatota archaeon]MCL5989254.1 hypothetical protein [Candidatus Thermoplasmatota archaeon]